MRWGVELKMRLQNRENESSSSKKVDLFGNDSSFY